VSGNGSNLQAIIEHIHLPGIAEISCVISNRPDAYALTRASHAHIPTRILNHTLFASRELFDTALTNEIDPYSPTYIVLAGFMRILSENFINHYPNRIINIHPSLLPKYKGLNTHARALAANEQTHGSTVHLVTSDLDDGPILGQVAVPVMPTDTPASLGQRVLLAEHQLYTRTLCKLFQSHLVITPDGAVTPVPVLDSFSAF